jgi:predicted permease
LAGCSSSAEVALTVILVAAAGLTVRSLQELLRQDLGMATRGILTFTVGLPGLQAADIATERTNAERSAQFFVSFEERLRQVPGLSAVGAISMLPIAATGTHGPVRVPERVIRPEDSPLAEFRAVTPGYFDAMCVPLVAGRLPDARDTARSAPVVVVNETLARQLWPGVAPAAVVGRRLGLGYDVIQTWREVIGVTRDVRSRRPDAPPDAETYVPHAQAPIPSMSFTARADGSPDALVPAIRGELAQLDPQLPMAAVRSFEEVLAAATRNPRLYSVLTAVFGLLAGTLAIVGIYSLMSYSVAQRSRELAIRSALGASRPALLQFVLREGFVLSAAGIVVGLGGAYATSRLMQSLLYGVSPTDPMVFGATAAGVALMAVLGYLVPAVRAARVEAVVALRAE